MASKSDPPLTESQELLLAVFAFMHPVPLKLAQATAICEAFLDHHKMDYTAARRDVYDRTSLARLKESTECTETPPPSASKEP